MKNTRTVSKGRLREGQPLSMRKSGSPSGKRPFDAGVEGSKELNYLRKALTALGGKEVSQYATNNGVYTRGSSGGGHINEYTVEVWEFATSDYAERIPTLGECMHGTVNIQKSGKVYYEFRLDFGHPFTKSLQKIFKRAGLGDFKMTPTGESSSDNYNKSYYYEVDGVPSEDTPFDSVEGGLDLSEAAVAFTKLVNILKSANASYKEVMDLDPEAYYIAKGQIPDPNGMVVHFVISRDSDGSPYVEGSFDNDSIYVIDSMYPEDNDVKTFSARGALEEICILLDSIGSWSVRSPLENHHGGSPDFGNALRGMPKSPDSDVKSFKELLKQLVNNINEEIDRYNNDLDDDEAEELWWDNVTIDFTEEEAIMNPARQKKVTKMQKTAANDVAHRYESVMRHIRSIKESSQWNRETNPYAKAAFDAVFNLIDSSYIDLDQAEDDMMEEEYRAENNEMFQQVLQGIYHALEQFIPQVHEIFGPDGIDIIFGDELYDLGI